MPSKGFPVVSALRTSVGRIDAGIRTLVSAAVAPVMVVIGSVDVAEATSSGLTVSGTSTKTAR